MDNPKVTTPPELEIEPAGEANTTVSTTQPINDAVEPPQAEAAQPPTEPISTPETAQTEPASEPMAETPTAQMGRNEPLPESAPETETTTPNANPSEETPPQRVLPFSNTDDREENLVAPKAEESPRTQQGTAQPEPTPTPVPSPESLPAPRIPETGTGTEAPITTTPTHSVIALLLEKAKLTIQFRKQKKLVKIMTLFAKKSHITNDEVEKLLHVSDATATRYLSELEKRGIIKQTGKTGHAVSYTKK